MESISYQINVRKILLSNGRIVSESTFTVQNVQEFLLVQHLKRRILGYTAISCDEQRIVFAGKLLEDDVELNSYGMKNKDIVMLFAGQRDFEQYFEIENRVEMVIPDILKDEGICQQQLDNFESDFHQSIDKEAQVVELLPHDIFFKRTVELKITAKPQANYAIFIQKNTQPAKDLDIWRTIPCQSEEDGLLKLRLNTFSNMFVSLNPKEQYSIEEKITEQEMKSSNVKFHKFEPGLNFVISKPCDDESCSKAQNFPIQVLPLYYLKGEKLNISELDEYKCPCGDELNPYQISQIIIMLAQAKIIYAKDLGPGKKSPTQKIDLVAKGNDIMVIGNGQPTLYSKFIIWVKPAAKEPQEIKDLAKAGFLELNENGNAIGKMFQLSNDSGVLIKVLVGKFFNREGFTLESFNENAGNDLRRKKFEVEVTEDVDQFVKLINGGKYSSAMIISDEYQGTNTKRKEYVEAVYTFWKKGNGLMIFEDNDTTYRSLSNIVLRKLLGFTLHGNDLGCQLLIPSNSQIPEKGKFSIHEIFTGIVGSIHEGETIAKPEGVLPPSIKVIAKSSSDEPCIMCYDDENFGRVVIDTGYTKLFQKSYKKTAGTSQYIQNAVVWINRANLS